MKIAFVLQYFDSTRGGAERYIVNLAQFLLQCGHQVHIFAIDCRDLNENVIFHQVVVTGRGVTRLQQFSQKSEAMLRTETFDVIQAFEKTLYMDVFQPHSGVHRASVQRNLQASPNRLFRFGRALAKQCSSKERFFTEIEDQIYKLDPLPMFVPLSKMVQEHMRQYYQVPDEKMRLIFNGSQLEQFHPEERAITGVRLREQHGIKDELTFLFVALNYRRKGLYYLLQAARVLKQEHAGAEFKILIVGRGHDRYYAQLASKFGLGNQVVFAGEQSNIHEYYLAGDVLVLPTFYDPCSLVVFEALAAGLPVITTKYNGAGEIILNTHHGWIVNKPEDVIGIARAMGSYFDREKLQGQRLAARQLAEEYPLQRSFEQMEQLYQEIAADKLEIAGSQR